MVPLWVLVLGGGKSNILTSFMNEILCPRQKARPRFKIAMKSIYNPTAWLQIHMFYCVLD